MRRAFHKLIFHLVPLLSAVAVASACTLDIDVPVEPPPENWDPALNTHPDGARFQNLLDRYVRDGLPGVVLLVRTPPGQWNGAAGYASIEATVPMLATHRHHAASVTKMYTATAVMLLAEDGLINLDTAISTYLPETVWSQIPNGNKATVRQLLGHTSGIPDFSGALAYDLDFLNDPLGSYPPERLLGYLHGQSPKFSPGNGYFYSNANYLILALLMNRVAKGGHASVISERIIQALGLKATYYRNEPGYPRPPGLVNSYQDLAGDGRLMNVSDMTIHTCEVFFGNAGLIATSADFADFIEGLLEGRVVDDASLSAMLQWNERGRYGLGLNFIESPYGVGVGHSGADFGVLSQVRHFPDLGATLVLLVNGGDSGITERLFNRLWDEAMRDALGNLGTTR